MSKHDGMLVYNGPLLLKHGTSDLIVAVVLRDNATARETQCMSREVVVPAGASAHVSVAAVCCSDPLPTFCIAINGPDGPRQTSWCVPSTTRARGTVATLALHPSAAWYPIVATRMSDGATRSTVYNKIAVFTTWAAAEDEQSDDQRVPDSVGVHN